MKIKNLWLRLNNLMYQRVIQHKFRYLTISLLKTIATFFTYIILVLSLGTSLILLMHTFYREISVITYYKNAHKFPALYILNGTLKIISQEVSNSNKNIEVLIGGYKTKVNSPKFSLVFLSAQDKDIPVIIRIERNGIIKELIRYINKQDNSHYIHEEFVIDARNL